MLLRQNKAPDALRECDRTLAAEPNNLAYKKTKAAILVRLLEYEDSIEVCEEILEVSPNEPTVWISMGHMLKTVGRREDCISSYRKAIELAPEYGEAYWSLVNLKTAAISDAELKSMQAKLQRSGISIVDRTHLHFAMRVVRKFLLFPVHFPSAAGRYCELCVRPGCYWILQCSA